MLRNLLLCVGLCVTAGCMTTGGTGGTMPTPAPAEQCPATTEPRLPPPPPLPTPSGVAEITRMSRENVSHIVVFLCPERQRLEAVGVNLSRYTLPFWIRGQGPEELSRFFTEAYRLGVPITVYTDRIPVRRPADAPPPPSPATAPGAPANATDTETCATCEINGAGQTTTTAGEGGGGGGRPPDWVIQYLPEVVIRTAYLATKESLENKVPLP